MYAIFHEQASWKGKSKKGEVDVFLEVNVDESHLAARCDIHKATTLEVGEHDIVHQTHTKCNLR